MYKVKTNKGNIYFSTKESLEKYAEMKCQQNNVFSNYCKGKRKDIDRTIGILGNLGYITEEIENEEIEDKEGDYEANVLYAEMVAEQVISY